MKLRIAILGCRGIPNFYGGFEKLAECLSVGLVEKGHHVTVYNSHNHPYQKKNFYGVRIVHCYDPEYQVWDSQDNLFTTGIVLNMQIKRTLMLSCF